MNVWLLGFFALLTAILLWPIYQGYDANKDGHDKAKKTGYLIGLIADSIAVAIFFFAWVWTVYK